jgi:hypothetical protein
MRLQWAIVLIVVLGVVGCAEVNEGQPQIVVTRQTALAEGVLAMNGECLQIVGDRGRSTYTLVLAPESHTIERTGDEFLVRDVPLGESATWVLGQAIKVGGGVSRAPADTTPDSIYSRCPEPYWLVGGVE